MNSTRKLLAVFTIGALATLLAWGCHAIGWMDGPEHFTWNLRQRRLAQPADPATPIRLILLDVQSLAWAQGGMGVDWPWPYEMYTPIIRFCRQSGAKVIALDLPLDLAGRYGEVDDRRLAETLAGAADIALAVRPGNHPEDATQWPASIHRQSLNVVGLDTFLNSTGAQDLRVDRIRFPYPQLAQSAAVLGHVLTDTTPTIRPIVRFDDVDLPALGLAAYLIGREQTPAELKIEANCLQVSGVVIPLMNDGRTWLRYRKPTEVPGGRRYPGYGAAAVIQSQLRLAAGEKPTIDPAEFKDAYVFLGLSDGLFSDQADTPATDTHAGLEAQATLLDNLLHQSFPRRVPWYGVLVFVLGISILGATGILCAGGWVRQLGVSLLALLIPSAVSVLTYHASLAWPMAWPTLGVGLALLSTVVFRWSTIGRERRRFRRVLGPRLSSAVMQQALADPGRVPLNSERRELSLLNLKLEGFSDLVEQVEPTILTDLLKHYLERMSEAILAEDGTLDTFRDDTVRAFWNAPLDQPDHAVRACRSALRCKERIVGLRREWFDWAGREPRIRIGLHTGPCTVGNMGVGRRFNYTALGEAVSLVSKLEGVNKVFGTTVLATQRTWAHVSGQLAGRGIGRVRLPGNKEPVIVIEPYSLKPDEPHATGEAFDEALMLCEAGRFADAMHRFHQLGPDPVSQAYADQLAKVLKAPNPSWDCIWDQA